jgi:hypothetical protein
MDLIPGFIQGITRVSISYPFDYIKTHLQMNKSNSIKEFIKKNSIKNMYRGISIPLCIIPIDRAIQFKIYENLNKSINPFYSGLICGITSSCINLPLNTISNNYILNEKETNLKRYIHKTFYNKNLKFFFYGYKPELIRSMLSTSIYLGMYGNLRNKYGNSNKQCIINSSISGISLWTIVYPFETLKIEQQTNNNEKITKIINRRVNNFGILNLWKGILPIYIRILPSSILGMLAYENARNYLL